MDVLFLGDRRVANDGVGFTESLTPFPEPVNSFYSAPTADSRSEKIELEPQQPPQKLRPIRCNGRTFRENLASAEAELGSKGSLTTCHSELGFLTQLSPLKPNWGSGGAEENGGVVVAGEHVQAVDVQGVRQITSEIKAQCMEIAAQGQLLEAELSSSSDDGGDSTNPMGRKHLDRKRKRKARRSIELFMESMVSKVIQRQEEMHKQLMDMIEKNEQERITREESWKQQEIERARRYEEVRAQERSRSLALISFIQNALGLEIPIPKSAQTSSLDDGETRDSKDKRWDPSHKRWSESEVQALITVRTAFDQKFFEGSPKGSVWEDIAAELVKMGYNRSAKKCKEKWENINKYYKRTMETGKTYSENSRMRPYFHELGIIYRSGGVVNPESVSPCVKQHDTEEDNRSTEE